MAVQGLSRDVLVDVIFRPSGIELTEEVIQRAATISVMAIATPVMALEDVLVTMLCALDEHARAHQPIAVREGFMTVVEELGIAPADSAAAEPTGAAAPGCEDQRRRVRVLGAGA